jgi:hypothetical protein
MSFDSAVIGRSVLLSSVSVVVVGLQSARQAASHTGVEFLQIVESSLLVRCSVGYDTPIFERCVMPSACQSRWQASLPRC